MSSFNRSLVSRLPGFPALLVRKCWLQARVARLLILGRFSKASVVGQGGAVVSLTSYGGRVEQVNVAIESIARGSVLPSRLILWLDDEAAFRDPPIALRRLQQRGLEILFAENHGPHTKYYPYLEISDTLTLPLVTADDDVLYPRYWLDGLLQAFKERSDVVNCYRARVISRHKDGLSKYEGWPKCESSEASFNHFATGVSGVIYPPDLLESLKGAGRAFQHCCPKADDIWLHVQALRARYMVRQFVLKARDFPILPSTQGISLQQLNVSGPDAGNDRQAKLTYTERDLQMLR